MTMFQTTINSEPEKFPAYLLRAYQFRSLVWVFIKRDFKIRYAQTFLGAFWSVLYPLINLFVYLFFFGKLVPVGGVGYPYPVFVMTGLMGWLYFSAAVNSGSSVLVQQQELIRKLNFPRILLPFSKSLAAIADMLVCLFIVLILLIYYHIVPTAAMLLFPLFLLFNFMLVLCINIWFSILSIKYRDVLQAIPVLIGFSIWFTPVFYPANKLQGIYSFLLYLNPLAGTVEGYRWTLLGASAPDLSYFFSFAVVLFLLLLGIYYFKNKEGLLNDEI